MRPTADTHIRLEEVLQRSLREHPCKRDVILPTRLGTCSFTETERRRKIGAQKSLAQHSQLKGIRPRYGAVGKHGSITVVERFIRTMKDEATRRILIPQRRAALQRELNAFFAWYNEHRPHATLRGKTPNEVYFRLQPANRRPRIEPRKRWQRNASCAAPRTLIAGQPGDRFTLQVDFQAGRRHLPIISLQRAA